MKMSDKEKKELKKEKKKKEEVVEEISPEERIKELEGEVAILKNEYAKAYADTENTRKRLQEDANQFKKYHIQSFALEVLPVLDNCERALKQETVDEAYRTGVEMIYQQLKSALEKEGVTEIEAEGKEFDANYHQALVSEHKDDVEPGMVLEVLQKGYLLKDRLLRASLVKVSE